ncbi:MAG: hypothetical protein ACOCUS_00030 [Polyangiales bacterium]
MFGLGIALAAALAGGAFLLSRGDAPERARGGASEDARARYDFAAGLSFGDQGRDEDVAADPDEVAKDQPKYENGFPATAPDAGHQFEWNRTGAPELWFIKSVNRKFVVAERDDGKVKRKSINYHTDRWPRPGEQWKIDGRENWTILEVRKINYDIRRRGGGGGRQRMQILPSLGKEPNVEFFKVKRGWQRVPVVAQVGGLVKNVVGVVAGLFEEDGTDELLATGGAVVGGVYGGAQGAALGAQVGSSLAGDGEEGDTAAEATTGFAAELAGGEDEEES